MNSVWRWWWGGDRRVKSKNGHKKSTLDNLNFLFLNYFRWRLETLNQFDFYWSTTHQSKWTIRGWLVDERTGKWEVKSRKMSFSSLLTPHLVSKFDILCDDTYRVRAIECFLIMKLLWTDIKKVIIFQERKKVFRIFLMIININFIILLYVCPQSLATSTDNRNRSTYTTLRQSTIDTEFCCAEWRKTWLIIIKKISIILFFSIIKYCRHIIKHHHHGEDDGHQ